MERVVLIEVDIAEDVQNDFNHLYLEAMSKVDEEDISNMAFLTRKEKCADCPFWIECGVVKTRLTDIHEKGKRKVWSIMSRLCTILKS